MQHNNYWLDLIKFEKNIKQYIEQVVNIFVGRQYQGILELRLILGDAIRDCLDEVAVNNKILSLNVDYELHLDYEDDIFYGFSVEHVFCD